MPTVFRWNRILSLTIAVLAANTLALGLAALADAAGKRQGKLHHAVEVARHQKGDPYRYGANGPTRFDCSGLVEYSYGAAVFRKRGGPVYHVAIYTVRTRHNRRRMVHAPSPGTRVQTGVPWTGHWYAATLRR